MKSKGKAAVGFNCDGLSVSMEGRKAEGRKAEGNQRRLLSSAHGTGNTNQNWQIYDN